MQLLTLALCEVTNGSNRLGFSAAFCILSLSKYVGNTIKSFDLAVVLQHAANRWINPSSEATTLESMMKYNDLLKDFFSLYIFFSIT